MGDGEQEDGGGGGAQGEKEEDSSSNVQGVPPSSLATVTPGTNCIKVVFLRYNVPILELPQPV